MPKSVTGVQIMQGIGHREAKGFWTEVWMQVLGRPGAICGLSFIAIVAFFAIFSPLIANGHPIIMWTKLDDGSWGNPTSPLWRFLTPADILLMLGGIIAPFWLLLPMKLPRSTRLLILLMVSFQAGITVVVSDTVSGMAHSRDAAPWLLDLQAHILVLGSIRLPWIALIIATCCALPFLFLGSFSQWWKTLLLVGFVVVIASITTGIKWNKPLEKYDYWERAANNQIKAIYTPIPFGPNQADSSLYSLAPGKTLGESYSGKLTDSDKRDRFYLGTDTNGQDVLSQILHACRLSISIGLVSTGIAVTIGITVGAIMGYFGGWIDLVLYRVVEIFMAVPLLFLLIVAAAVLPRNTYVMMAIIGCFTWTGAARFTRAEFMKLRNQDFVQSARSVGLPLRSILFKHMLPNGVTPVLVDASFAIAAAIIIEANLSFLELGPTGQASWGKLLNSATGDAGTFNWWMAVFPGAAIFLTVLSYNLIGEALRDAIDPKLKKARV